MTVCRPDALDWFLRLGEGFDTGFEAPPAANVPGRARSPRATARRRAGHLVASFAGGDRAPPRRFAAAREAADAVVNQAETASRCRRAPNIRGGQPGSAPPSRSRRSLDEDDRAGRRRVSES